MTSYDVGKADRNPQTPNSGIPERLYSVKYTRHRPSILALDMIYGTARGGYLRSEWTCVCRDIARSANSVQPSVGGLLPMILHCNSWLFYTKLKRLSRLRGTTVQPDGQIRVEVMGANERAPSPRSAVCRLVGAFQYHL